MFFGNPQVAQSLCYVGVGDNDAVVDHEPGANDRRNEWRVLGVLIEGDELRREGYNASQNLRKRIHVRTLLILPPNASAQRPASFCGSAGVHS
jgi:hypothetical protein